MGREAWVKTGEMRRILPVMVPSCLFVRPFPYGLPEFWSEVLGEGLGLKYVVSKPAIPNGGYSASLVVRKWGECQVRGQQTMTAMWCDGRY